MFKQLQEEHKVWAEKNFGKQDVEDYCLGMIEEVGELAHAVLKRKQGIRCTEDHDAMIRDAVGDISIYLVGFCNCENRNLGDYYIPHETFAFNGTVVGVNSAIVGTINAINDISIPFNIREIIGCLNSFCKIEGFDFEQTVMDTWKNVVSKRDWKNDPDCLVMNLNGFEIPMKRVVPMKVIDSKIHLCDNCQNEFPVCISGDVVFGNGKGGDNIIECEGFKQKLAEYEDMGYPV